MVNFSTLLLIALFIGSSGICAAAPRLAEFEFSPPAYERGEDTRIVKIAADLDDPQAQVKFASLRLRGGNDIPQDYREAAKWLLKAAERGHGASQSDLGVMHFKGLGGLAFDEKEGLKWLRKSADSGDPNGRYNLGVAYARGRGVERNLDLARKWFKKAAKKGHETAGALLKDSYAKGLPDPEMARGVDIDKGTFGFLSLGDEVTRDFLDGIFASKSIKVKGGIWGDEGEICYLYPDLGVSLRVKERNGKEVISEISFSFSEGMIYKGKAIKRYVGPIQPAKAFFAVYSLSSLVDRLGSPDEDGNLRKIYELNYGKIFEPEISYREFRREYVGALRKRGVVFPGGAAPDRFPAYKKSYGRLSFTILDDGGIVDFSLDEKPLRTSEGGTRPSRVWR